MNPIDEINGWHGSAYSLNVNALRHPGPEIRYGLWVINRTNGSLIALGGHRQYLLALGPIDLLPRAGLVSYTVGLVDPDREPYRIEHWPGDLPHTHGTPLRVTVGACPDEVIPQRAARYLMTQVVNGHLSLAMAADNPTGRHPAWDALWTRSIVDAVHIASTDHVDSVANAIWN